MILFFPHFLPGILAYPQSFRLLSLLPSMSAEPFPTFTRKDFGFPSSVANNEFHFPLEPLATELTGSARIMLAYERYTVEPVLLHDVRQGTLIQ